MYILKKPKRFEVHLYVDHLRFKDESWKKDVGEELFILGKQMMEGLNVIPSRILDHGGDVGEIIIDYPEDDESPASQEKSHKEDISVQVDKGDAGSHLKQELADVLLRIAGHRGHELNSIFAEKLR